MRHKKKFNHLGRKRGHRHAMLSNMASSLILHKRIKTTTAKAKALKIFVEPLITKAKDDTTHSRRQVFSYLQDKDATSELFREVAIKVADRPGGYTRIIKLGNRLGDNADMCIIELVDYNENLLAEKAAAAKSSRRRRGGKKKADAPAAGTAETDVAVEEAPEVENAAAEDTADVAEEVEAVAEDSATEDAEVTAEETVADEPEAVAEEVTEKVEEAPDATSEEVVEAPEKKEEKPAEAEETKAEAKAEEAPEAKNEESTEEEKKED